MATLPRYPTNREKPLRYPPGRPEPSQYRWLTIIGFLAAIFVPVIGLILGIVRVTRRDIAAAAYGWTIIGLSVAMWVIAMLVGIAR